jgi:hypothetical protein
MEEAEYRAVFADRGSVIEAYQAGLKHGLVTIPIQPPPPQDAPCHVWIELPFLKKTFRAKGAVVHPSDVATVVWLQELPDELRSLILALESAPTPSPRPVLLPGEAGPADDESPSGEHIAAATPPAARPVGMSARERLQRARRADFAAKKSKAEKPAKLSKPAVAVTPVKITPSSKPVPPPRSDPPTRPPAAASRGPAAIPESAALSRVSSTPSPPPATAQPSYGFPIPGAPERQIPAECRLEGNFSERTPYEMFLQLKSAGLTGVGVVALADARYWLYCLNGEPVDYRRDPPLHALSIEALLVKRGLLPAAVLGEIRLLSDVTGRSLVSVVMRMGLVTEAALDGLRREQAAAITSRLLDAAAGSYQFFEFPNIAGVFRDKPEGLLRVMWKNARSAVQEAGSVRRQAWTESLRKHHVMTTAAGERLRRDLPIDEPERKLVERSTRPGRPVSRLLKHTRMGRREALDALLALERMGVLTLCSTDVEDQGTTELETSVRARFGRLHKDHFQFLDLHWSALPDEVLARCDAVEKEVRAFDKAGAFITNFAEVRNRVTDRLEKIRKLADSPVERKQYRKNLVGEAKLLMTAEQLVQQGEMALFREEPDNALECFLRAEDVEPGGAGSYKRVERVRTVLAKLGQEREDIPGFE